MARTAETMETDYDVVLRDYVRILTRRGTDDDTPRSPGHDARTCPSCGQRASFALDPQGTWFRCPRCGQFA